MGSPVSPIVANLFMEDLEQRAIETAPSECKPRLWKRYVDDIVSVINRGQADNLKDHLNTIDSTGSIKFTVEVETEGSLPFFDTKLITKEDGSIKFVVFRKKDPYGPVFTFSEPSPTPSEAWGSKDTTRSERYVDNRGRRQEYGRATRRKCIEQLWVSPVEH